MPASKPDVRISARPTMRAMKSRLEKRLEEIGVMTVPNKKAAIFLDRWVQQNFRTEGGSVGGWAPIQRKGKILQDTGRLRLSFLPFADSKDAGVGSKLDYAEKHDKGIRIQRRRILPEHREVDDDLFKLYDQHVENLTSKRL